MNGIPPELVAEYDQSLAGNEETLDRLVNIYLRGRAMDDACDTPEALTFLSLAQVLRNSPPEPVADVLAVAIRRLATRA